MKKITAVTLALGLMFLFRGCKAGEKGAYEDFGYKLGMAAYTHADDSKGYTAGTNGQDRVSTTYVSLVMDNDGRILRASIDEVESRLDFDGTGRLVGRKTGAIKSKKELRDEYNMRPYSPIGKEWYEQINTLEDWLVGKNIREIVSGTQLNGDIYPNSDGKNRNSLNNSSTGTGNSVNNDSSFPEGEDIPQNPNGTLGGTVPDNTLPDSGANMNGGMTDNMSGMTGDMFNDGMDGEGMYTGWMDDDLKAGVTIDTTYIYRAIKKAYENAM